MRDTEHVYDKHQSFLFYIWVEESPAMIRYKSRSNLSWWLLHAWCTIQYRRQYSTRLEARADLLCSLSPIVVGGWKADVTNKCLLRRDFIRMSFHASPDNFPPNHGKIETGWVGSRGGKVYVARVGGAIPKLHRAFVLIVC